MTATVYTATQVRERLSPEDLLTRFGYEPVMVKSGYEYIYRSMLRPDPLGAFYLDTRLGVWYDRGGENASGIRKGDVIDLAKALFHPMDLDTVLAKLSKVIDADRLTPRRKRRPKKLPHYKLAETRSLGINGEITHYLRSQGLWELAVGHMQEVYYYFTDEKRRRKDYFGAGWPNENGGWEVRSKCYAGCIGPAGMTFLPNDDQRLIIFLHYQDYLNWRYVYRGDTRSVLVLNATSFASAARFRASQFADAVFFGGANSPDEDVIKALQEKGAKEIRLLNYHTYGQVCT